MLFRSCDGYQIKVRYVTASACGTVAAGTASTNTNCAASAATTRVVDSTPPSIAELPSASTIYCPAVPDFELASASDACDPSVVLTFVNTTTPGSCTNNYSVTRTWTATDACGNSSTATQTINVEDINPPVISSLPAPSTAECTGTPSFATATATDDCDSSPSLTFTNTTTAGTCGGNYTVTRTWTATDACGNSSTASQTITLTDNTAPVIASLPAPSTISCSTAPSFASAIATDACDASPSLTFSNATTAGSCSGYYSVTRTWTATDACGNSSTSSQTINVQDITPPVISSLPSPSTITCTSTPSFATATATDACDGSPSLTFSNVTTSETCSANYSVTRTWTATDACGNSSTASQTINVQDLTPPVISSLPAPSTIGCTSTPSFATATATDACDGSPSLTFNNVTTAGTCSNNYSVTRTWTATDVCGNSSTASQVINVQDITAPVIASLPAPSTINCPATPSFVTATATDECTGSPTLTFSNVTTAGSCANNYSVTRTWTATDVCGNSSTASQVINVQDITAPVIASLPAPSTINCPATPSLAAASASDACDEIGRAHV